MEYAYEAPAAAVFAMFTNEEFLLAKFAATGALDYSVLENSPTPDGGHRVSTRRTVVAEIPGFAKRILNPKNTLTQIEDWASPLGGEWRVETKGVPVTTGGNSHIESTADGCVQHIDGRIKVSVPLIGGRLEKFIFAEAKKTMDAEHTFGQQWLADHA